MEAYVRAPTQKVNLTKKGMTLEKHLSPLISSSCCGICFLLSGSCSCHSDEWGRSAKRQHLSDGKHRDRVREEEKWRARERDEAGEGEGIGEGRQTTTKKGKQNDNGGDEEEWQQQWLKTERERETDAVWVAGWHSAWDWMCKHTQSSSDWHRNCSKAQQAFPSNTPYQLRSLSTHGTCQIGCI